MFETYKNHFDPFVAETAKKLERYAVAFQNGEISESEFTELADDLTDYQRINEAAKSVEHRVMLKQAFDGLKSLLGALF